MSKEENKILLEKFILNNPFDFKQGIINHCRQMDKIDVYEWVAEDELRIKQLHKRLDRAIEYIEENKLNGNKISEMLCGSEIVKLLEILIGGYNE